MPICTYKSTTSFINRSNSFSLNYRLNYLNKKGHYIMELKFSIRFLFHDEFLKFPLNHVKVSFYDDIEHKDFFYLTKLNKLYYLPTGELKFNGIKCINEEFRNHVNMRLLNKVAEKKLKSMTANEIKTLAFKFIGL